MEETYKHIWDPLSADLPLAEYQKDADQLTTKYQKGSRELLKLFFVYCALGIFAGLFAVYITNEWLSIAYGLIPFGLFIYQIYLTQNRIMLALLCLKNGWIFAPRDDSKRGESLAALIPAIFDHGHSRRVTNQIWGSISGEISFWTGRFSYTIGAGKYQTTVSEQIFIFHLPKYIPLSLSLKREAFFKTIIPEIKTESKEFNDTFIVTSPVDTKEVRQEIINLLSPSVQTRLIDFAKQYKTAHHILFHSNMMIIVFGPDMWKPKSPNPFLSQDISHQDMLSFENDLETMALLPSEMIQFMD